MKLSYSGNHATAHDRKVLRAVVESLGGRSVRQNYHTKRKIFEVTGGQGTYQARIRMSRRDDYGRPTEDISLVTITIEGFARDQRQEAVHVELGTKLIANFGAMFPTVEGQVTDIDEDGWLTINNPDGEDHACKADEILPYGAVSANGSPIGVFLGDPPALPPGDDDA